MESNVYQHSFPTELSLVGLYSPDTNPSLSTDIYNKNFDRLYGSRYFVNFFRRIKKLSIFDYQVLRYIPISYLFGNKKRFNGKTDSTTNIMCMIAPNTASPNEILSLTNSVYRFVNNISNFCVSNYGFEGHYNIVTDENCYNVIWNDKYFRKIEKLNIVILPRTTINLPNANDVLGLLVSQLAVLSRRLYIQGKFVLNEFAQILSIFHRNLEYFEYDSNCFIVNEQLQKIMGDICQEKDYNLCPKLWSMYYHVQPGNLSEGIKLLEQFDTFLIRRNVHHFYVEYPNHSCNFGDPNGAPIMDNIETVFWDKLLCDRIKNHSIDNITVEICDWKTLTYFAKYCVYLNEKFESHQLIHLKMFEIRWRDIVDGWCYAYNIINSTNSHEIFNVDEKDICKLIENRDDKVSTTNCNEINVYNCDFKIKTLGAVIKKIINKKNN